MIVAGTGHRPPRLGLGYGALDRFKLIDFAQRELEEIHFESGISAVISGLAQGWDQAIAEASIDLGFPLWVAIPFEGQESKWPEDAQERYNRIRGKAAKVTIVCPGDYASWKFIARDKWMVESSDLVLALFDGNPKSGTGATVAYAQLTGKPVKNVWDAWNLNGA